MANKIILSKYVFNNNKGGKRIITTNYYPRKKGQTEHNIYQQGKLVASNRISKSFFEKEEKVDLGTDIWWSDQEIIDGESNYYFDVFQWGNIYVIQDANLIKFEVKNIGKSKWQLIGELL